MQYFGVNLEIKPVNKPNSELARIRRYWEWGKKE